MSLCYKVTYLMKGLGLAQSAHKMDGNTNVRAQIRNPQYIIYTYKCKNVHCC